MADTTRGRSAANRSDAPINNDIASSQSAAEVCSIAIALLLPAYSPRLSGENDEHIRRLAETESALPPILVHRSTMRVIDGMHRLRAATLKGLEEILVRFFDGSEEDAFIQAVNENAVHGLPLSLADRKAAARRILASHPQLSDRTIARYTGLVGKTVATIRERSSADVAQSSTRIGADGRVRPLAASDGRRRASEIIAARPGASLREIARDAEVSVGTAHDVRRRLRDGHNPLPPRPDHPDAEPTPRVAPSVSPSGSSQAIRVATPTEPSRRPGLILDNLMRDPSLRHSEAGRELLRHMRTSALETDDWSRLIGAVPAHCLESVATLARQYAETWRRFAHALEHRDANNR